MEHGGDHGLQDQKQNSNGKFQSSLIPLTMGKCHCGHHTETEVEDIINDCVFSRKLKRKSPQTGLDEYYAYTGKKALYKIRFKIES